MDISKNKVKSEKIDNKVEKVEKVEPVKPIEVSKLKTLVLTQAPSNLHKVLLALVDELEELKK